MTRKERNRVTSPPHEGQVRAEMAIVRRMLAMMLRNSKCNASDDTAHLDRVDAGTMERTASA